MIKRKKAFPFLEAYKSVSYKGKLSSLCAPSTPPNELIKSFERVGQQRSPLKKRERLFCQGNLFDSIYIVRAGSLKKFTYSTSNGDQITDFYLPGDLIGLDCIGETHCPGTVTALETATVCEIPYQRIEQLTENSHKLRKQLFISISKELHNKQLMMHLLLRCSSDVRLACFFIALSLRFKRLGYSPYKFRLTMSRSDMGNYLGLAVETVSRLLKRFQQMQLLAVDGRELHILDMERLDRLASRNDP